MIHDMNAQYIDFYAYMRSVMSGRNNFIYSFSRGLGGDFPSFFAYYLISPFNIIPILLPDELMPVGVSLEMFLLFGLSGLACFYSLEYFTGNERERKLPFLLFLSIGYSFSGWMLLNAENFQFIQEAVILPMVVMNCQKVRKGGKIFPAVLWIAISVILNFYIGYMVCIFSFLWMAIPDENKFDKRVFLLFSTALLISSPVLIIIIRKLGTTVKNTDSLWYVPAFNFSVPEFLRKLLPGQFDHLQYQDNGLPAVYCGLIPCFAAIYYFIYSKNIAEKRHRLIIFLILVFSLFFRPFTMIWQGFSQPHWWPYRFSFLLIYLIILCASGCPIKNYMNILIPIGIAGFVYNLDVTLKIKLEYNVPLSAYTESVKTKASALEPLTSNDEFYRVEDLAPRSDNDAMHFSYPGITHFDSLANRKVFTFLENLGFKRDRYTLQYGLGNTYFANYLLGVRYVLDSDRIISFDPAPSAAYLLESDIDNYEIADTPASFQNMLAASLKFQDLALESVKDFSYDLVNLECDEVFCWKDDYESESSVIFHAAIPENSMIYGHVENDNLVGELFYEIGDSIKVSVLNQDWFVPLFTSDDNTSTDIKISIDSAISDFPAINFYVENKDSISKKFAELSEGLTVTKISSSELYVSFPEKDMERKLLVTVPYDKGWKAYSDGSELTVSEIWDTFMVITVPPNVSDVRCVYH